MFWKINNKGQSLLEVIIAMAIFALIASTMSVFSIGGMQALQQGGDQTEAEALAQEGIEAVRAIRDRAWNELTYTTSSVSVSGGEWIFDGEGTTEQIGKYTRTISLSSVCRDGLDDIVSCPGSYTDLHSKQVNVKVVWETREGITNEVEKTTYLTNWDSQKWTQTNWSGGAGQAIWSDETKYDSDDSKLDYDTAGEIKLVSLGGGGCGIKSWGFTASSSYTYDTDKIEVTGGQAQLVDQGGGGDSGFTTNPSFDIDASDWVYNDWDQGGGEENVNGLRSSSGGNPNGWVYVNFPDGRNDEFGGYWEQSFVTTEDDPTASLSFDWLVTEYESSPDTFQLYVFVDSSSGEPNISEAVWSSGEQTGTSGWVSMSDLDVSSSLGVAGTYYLKLAVWLETDGGDEDGPYEIGYDNVSLDWTSAGSSSYATDSPSVKPTQNHTVSEIGTWSSFSEVATKNSGEIYYQLSDNGGVSWRYWDDLGWGVAGESDYNTATVINSNIGTFPTSSGQIMFKAFLESDGETQVQLDEVQVSCAQMYDWPFNASSSYSYDSDKIEVASGTARLLQISGDSGTSTDSGFDYLGPGSHNWSFTVSSSYTYNPDDIEVTGGVSQLITVSGGEVNGIEDTVTDSYEFETTNGREPDMINIANNIYAIAYRGDSDDGFISTVEVNSNGEITESLIDTLEYDTSYTRFPDLIHVSGDIYAVVYMGNGSDGWLKTVEIDSGGNITNFAIDSLEFDTGYAAYPNIINLSGDYFAIAYQGPGSDGWLKTVEIDSNGNITNSTVDSYEFDTGNGREPVIINVDTDIYAIVSRGGSGDGFVDTVEIDSSGNITNSIIDTLEYDTSYGGLPDIINISGDIYAITYRGNGNDGWLKTVEIDSSGNITNSVVDSLEFDTSNGYFPDIIHVSDNYYLIIYRGSGSDGFAKLLTVETDGIIGSVIDTLEYDTSAGNYPKVLSLGGNNFVIAYQGPGSDGWLKTIELSAGSTTYTTSTPDIYPNTSLDITFINYWNSFSETAVKNSGEIYYQLSYDDGLNWYFWDSSDWALVSTSTDSNVATQINTNITSFSTSTGQIKFKAFLESDGEDQVQLDNINIGYDTPASPWSFYDWGVGGGEETPTGTIQTSGGNPGNYAGITVLGGNSDEVGGYWQQTIVITEDSPNVNIDFDYKSIDFNGTPNESQIRIYLDSSTGNPTTQIGSSIDISAEGDWTTASSIDASSAVSGSGTYYLKIAFWVETGGGGGSGPFTIGFDNVELSWSGESYPTDIPAITPSTTFTGTNINNWNSFIETATKNGGEIYYQLSDDGNSWQYWSGSAWVTSTAPTDYNTSSTINSNISSFSTSTGQIKFKAFLESDGIQEVILDNVRVYWGEDGGGASGFETSGYLLSSAFDMTDDSPVQFISWSEDLSSCTPDCDIQLQIRTAPDSGGSPGSWGSWYGSGGSGTYFTSPTETMISNLVNGNRWLQYRAELNGDGTETPVLEEIVLDYK